MQKSIAQANAYSFLFLFFESDLLFIFFYQTNELAIYKTKASGLEEEMKKLKEIYEQQAVQKLSEEKGRLKAELAVQ